MRISSSSALVASVSLRSPGGLVFIASHAFTIRLRRTCWSCHAIGHGRGKVAGGEIRYRDTARDEIAAGEAEQFFETLIYPYRLKRDLSAAQHRAQPPDYFSGAAIRPDDVPEDLAKFDEVGWVMRHEALRRLCIAKDAGEWLVQFVRERTRERAQGGRARWSNRTFALQQRLTRQPVLPA